MIDISKLVKPSHLEKLQIIQNINKVMFQVIFTFSDQILIEFPPPLSSWGKETDFQKILPGVLTGGLRHE